MSVSKATIERLLNKMGVPSSDENCRIVAAWVMYDLNAAQQSVQADVCREALFGVHVFVGEDSDVHCLVCGTRR